VIDQTMTGRPAIEVLPSADTVHRAAAGFIARHLAEAIAARGVAHWATTGGSSAPGIYRALRDPALRDTVDWSKVHVWWGDDRFVPIDHPLSNVLPFDQVFLNSGGDDSGSTAATGEGVIVPAEHVHAIPCGEAIGLGEGPGWAAARYEATLLELGPAPGPDGVPAFDLLILGVGPDGHVLSVFPDSAVFDESALVVGVPAPMHVEPHVPRVTMHPRLVAAAGCVLVVTDGASKADLLAMCWGAPGSVRTLPARMTLLPQATWIVDEAAASGLR
jgi:6-phosphogluconolactonase